MRSKAIAVSTWFSQFRAKRNKHSSDSIQAIRRRFCVELLEDRRLLAGIELLKDINQIPISSDPGANSAFATLGSSVVFEAVSPNFGGRTLWKSDGTTAGTVELSASTGPFDSTSLVSSGSHVYFAARDSSFGLELWRTDGTSAGTTRLSDINPNSGNSGVSEITPLGTILLFRASNSSGSELWKFDTVTSQVSLVKDIFAGSGSSLPSSITKVGDFVYFVANDGLGQGNQLWRSDGTSSGTTKVSTTFSAPLATDIANLTDLNGKLVFSANGSGATGNELWAADGMSLTLLRDIYPGGLSSNPLGFAVVGSFVYFSASNSSGNAELWRTDGTTAGTTLAAEVRSGSTGSSPAFITSLGSDIYFNANAGTHGTELYRLTSSGAVELVKDIHPGMFASNPSHITRIGNKLVFSATDGVNGTELWESDGTLIGTKLIEMNPGAASSNPLGGPSGQIGISRIIGDKLFFRAQIAIGGGTDSELWTYDVVSGGLRSVNVNPSNNSASPNQFSKVGNKVYFQANDGISGSELWASDGTSIGTQLVKDIKVGTATTSSSPQSFTSIGSSVLFVASTATHGSELWISDGTEIGTSLVKDILSGATSSDISSMVSDGTIAYFMANDGINGSELWKSDGTPNGTQLVANLTAGSGSSSINWLTVVNGRAYFNFSTVSAGSELWTSDGTTLGTVQVADIYLGGTGSNPQRLTGFQGKVYFSATTASTGTELWSSDGTPSGTSMVKDIHSGASSAGPIPRIVNGNKLYFIATDAASGSEMWTTDGTSAGTSMIIDLSPGTASTIFSETVLFKSQVYFTASTPTAGQELWRTDGTAGGTQIVKDIQAGTSSSVPVGLAAGLDYLYFTANDGVHGRELWASDGTLVGTNMLVDYVPGAGSISANTFNVLGNSIVFPFGNSLIGTELFLATIAQGNNAPTNISLSAASIAENAGTNALVGTLSTVDPDAGDMFTYSLVSGAGSTDNALFNIEGNQLRVNNSLDFEASPTRSVRIRTTDQGGLSFEKSFTIQVTNVNEAPADITLTPGTVAENATSGTLVGGLAAVDDAGDTATFQFVSGGADNSQFTIDGNLLKTIAVFDYETKASYTISIRVTDSGNLTYEKALTINVLPINEFAPVFTSSATQTVAENNSAIGNVTVSDADFPAQSVTFSITGGPDQTRLQITPSGLLSFVTLPNFEAPSDSNSDNVYEVTLTADDGQGRTATQAVTVTVTNINESPSDVSVNNLFVIENAGIPALVGTLSTVDPDAGDTFTYSLVSGAGATDNALFNINGNELRASNSLDFETSPTRSVRVRTTDQGGLSFEKSFTIQVTNADEQPTSLNLSNNAILENLPAGTEVGSLSTIDPDGPGIFSYTLVGSLQDNSSFAIVGNELRTAISFDAETKQIYEIRIRSTDSTGLWVEQDLSVGVVDVNEFDPVFSSSGNRTINENFGSVMIHVTDQDIPRLLFGFSISGGADSHRFSIVNNGANDGVLSFLALPNFEAPSDADLNNTYEVQITVQDGDRSAVQNLTLAVTDVNESPTMVGFANALISLPEDRDTSSAIVLADVVVSDDALGTNQLTLSNDSSDFEILNNQLRLRAGRQLDFESRPSFVATVHVDDPTVGLSPDATATFTLSITNVNESPTDITLTPGTVAENAANGTVVGILAAADPDAGDTATFQFVSGGANNSQFTVDGNQLKTNAVFDYETKTSYSILVRATDSGNLTYDKTLTINVLPINEFAPVFTSSATRTVAENNIAIGNVTATDADLPAQTITFSITGGPDQSRLQITSAGLLSFVTNPDFETPMDSSGDNVYEVTLAANDGLGRTATQNVTVTVTNANDPPTGLALSNNNIDENLNAGTVIGQFSVTDQDVGDTVSFIFRGGAGATDNAKFEIVGNQLRSKQPFDYENPSQRLLYVRIAAMDSQGTIGGELQFTIDVHNVNEVPYGIELSKGIDKNTAAAVTLQGVDPEGQALTFVLTQQPSHGALTGTAPNLTYTPNFDFVGSDEFFFTVSDGTFTSFETRASIGVIGPKPTVSFVTSNATVSESVGAVEVTAQLSFPVEQDLWFPLTAANESTVSASDFLPLQSIKIAAGQTSGSAYVVIVDDSNFEGASPESLIVNLGTGYAANLGSPNQLTLSINDNDTQPVVFFERAASGLSESNDTLRVRVVLSGQSIENVVIPFSIASSTATLGSDYGNILPSSQQLIIPAGFSYATFTVSAMDDSMIEPDETVEFVLGTPTNAGLASASQGPTRFVFSIGDNDTPTVSMTAFSRTVSENVGGIQLSAKLSMASTSLIVVPVSFSGSATVPSDLTSVSPQFVFQPGSTSAVLELTIIDDSVVESPENLTAKLESGTGYKLGTVDRTILHVLDNDSYVVNFSAPTVTVWEDVGAITVTATLNSPAVATFSVPVIVSQDVMNYARRNADFAFTFVDFQFVPGSTQATRTIGILNDGVNEPIESFRLAFDPPSSAFYELGSDRSVLIQIKDDDPLVRLLTSNSQVRESATGPNLVDFQVELSAESNKPVSVEFNLSGTAKKGTDFNVPTTSPLVFLPGSTNKSIQFEILDDLVAENTESLTATLENFTNAVFVEGSSNSRSLTILDDDSQVVQGFGLNSDRLVISESPIRSRNRSVKATVSMGRAADRDVWVSIKISTEGRESAIRGRDFQIDGLANDQLKIPAGSTSATFDIVILHDTQPEANESFYVEIVKVTSPARFPSKVPRLTVSITDDDRPSTTSPPRLSLTSSNVPKTVTTQPAIVANALNIAPPVGGYSSGGLVVAASNSQASFGPIVPGSLNLGVGFQGSLEGASVFFDLNFNGQKDFADLNGNGLLDDDELEEPSTSTSIDGSFGMELGSEVDIDEDGQIGVGEGRWVLHGGVDNTTGLDWKTNLTSPPGLYSITPLTTLAESLTRTQSLSLSSAIARATEALRIENYDLNKGLSLHEVLAYDQLSSQAYTAHVQLYSAILEISQLLAGKSGLPVHYFAQEAFDAAAGLIASPGTTLDLSNNSIIEGLLRSVSLITNTPLDDSLVTGAAAIIAEASNRVSDPNLADYLNGDSFLLQVNRTKYVLQGSLAQAMFAVGAGTKTISSATSEFTGAALSNLIANAAVSVVVPPAIAINDLSIVEENTGNLTARFTVSLVGSHTYPVSVDYATSDSTAVAGQDYVATNGTITWSANDTTVKYIDVTVQSDASFESDERFAVLLANPVGLAIRQSEGSGFILNDDIGLINASIGGSLNKLYMTHRQETAELLENGLARLNGEFVEPLVATIQGQEAIGDQILVDFSANTYRNDNISFSGGSGAGDSFGALAGVFGTVEYSIAGTGDGRVRFIPEDVTRRSTFNLTHVESVDLSVSQVGTLILRVPSSVASLIVEDADTSVTGRTRIRSAINAFAPIEFTNPTTQLRLLTESATTQVTIDSNVENSVATIIQQGRTGITLNNAVIHENVPVGTTIGVFSSLEFGFDMFTPTLATGGANNSSVQIDADTLKTAGTIDYEATNSLAILIAAVSQSTGETIQQSVTIQVLDVLELSTAVQIGDGTTQRSVVNKLVVSFDQAIEFDAGAFQVYQRSKDSNNTLVLLPVTTNVTLTPDGTGMKATLTFAGAMTRSGTNALIDGNYQLVINGGLIRVQGTTQTFDADRDGLAGGFYTLGAQAADNFFALLGDGNGNGVVDAQDLLSAKLSLRKTVGQPGYNIAWDINGNGVVDAQDILNIQHNLRKKRVFF